jgi:serine protease
MLIRTLLISALALLSTTARAQDNPAWGLIVKLKAAPAAEPSTAYSASERAQATASSTQDDSRIDTRSASVAAAARAQMQSTLQRVGLAQTGHRTLVGATLHHVSTDRILTHAQAQTLADRLMASGDVEWAVPNRREHLQQVATTPNDVYFGSGDQWWAMASGGSNADLPPQQLRGTPNLALAWSLSVGSTTTSIAVLDTGLISHADLDPARLLPGRNFHHGVNSNGTMSASLDQSASNTTDPGDYLTQTEKDANPTAYQNCSVTHSSWHGTAVTGVIAATANNGTGLAGANWNVRIMPVRVAGKCGAWESDILDAMNWVAGDDNGNHRRADIISISFGHSGSCDAAYLSIFRKLKQRGVVVAASAGNEHGAVGSPANCVAQSGTENVVSVAALTRDGLKASYSNFGPEVTLSTVGGDTSGFSGGGYCSPSSGSNECGILTITNDGLTTTNPGGSTYIFGSGTSFSAPIAAATAALAWGVNPNLTADQVVSTLKASARPHQTSSGLPTCSSGASGNCTCTTQTCGTGVLDAYQAILMARDNPPAAAAATGPAENQGGGGGGGSSGALALLGLGAATGLIAWRVRAQVPPTRRA